MRDFAHRIKEIEFDYKFIYLVDGLRITYLNRDIVIDFEINKRTITFEIIFRHKCYL